MKLSLVFFAALCVVRCAFGATFYIDPQRGSAAGDGSARQPWLTLRQVVESNLISTQEWTAYPYAAPGTLKPKNATAPVKAGDTLLLLSGCHDSVLIQRSYNADAIVIAAAPGHRPYLRNIRFSAASRWVLRGVHVSPEHCGVFKELTLVNVETHNYNGPSREITIESCTLSTAWNSSAWTIENWNDSCCSGISSSGRQITIRNNYLRNVDFGITVSGDSCRIENNTVENFAGDGLRGLGNDCVFTGNLIKNCYDVNANHDDGFQSWSTSGGVVGAGSVYRVTLCGNTFINNTDPNQPFKGTLQGIGCFDGFYDGWVIENNVVITDHWHGITLLGARNCRIVNNTVVDVNAVTPGPPWIRIGAHKTLGSSSNCIVRNNLATAINNDTSSTVVADHNIIVRTYNDFFVDYAAGNLRLKPGSIAIDSGSSVLAPAVDFDGVSRPQGARVDVGAFEYTTAAVGPERGAARATRSLRPGAGHASVRLSWTAHLAPTGLRMQSSDGRCVYHAQIPAGSDSHDVPSAAFAPGVYILTLIRGAETVESVSYVLRR